MSRKKSVPHSPLSRRIAALRRFYGKPATPAIRDLFGQILWENVAYLADDRRRAEAFETLRRKVGLDPKRILAAPLAALREIGRQGILPDASAKKLRECARVALEEFGGDLAGLRDLPPSAAKKALRKFPSIGEPGAEKILVFAGLLRAVALDSNAVRVLERLGYGRREKSYAAGYRAAQAAVAGEIPAGAPKRIEMSQLLRLHGKELCKSARPRCEPCPLRPECAYFGSASGASAR